MAKQATESKRIFYFGASKTEGNKEMRELLGGKGANLAEMTSIGLPVPPGFTITTQTCADYNEAGRKFPQGLTEEIRQNVALLEKETAKKFGSADNPLLVSVRSGAAKSMPGMMDTILNLGLTDDAVRGLAAATDNERFALDAYRRLIDMFGAVVMEIHHEHFENEFAKIREKYNAAQDTDVPTEGLKELVEAYKSVYKEHTKADFPQDPLLQLEKSIEAVFRSWNTPRAAKYREIENIRGLLGTAVNVQSMVYGNMGDDCGTGVCFTRNNATGENILHGDFLVNCARRRRRRRHSRNTINRGCWQVECRDRNATQ